ncbi:IS5 family transposase [Nocardiopsis aegyptia]|uniref:IS5 family transposase n=1 Tax=Nocardiopsis aegyptia TaxID=220378 RepID=UPI00366E0781
MTSPIPHGRSWNPCCPPSRSKRTLINGIRWGVRVGAPWRDVPERYGPWQSVYHLFRVDGTWARILDALRALADAAGLITWDLNVDSTVVRAHQHSAGAAKKGEHEDHGTDEPDDHALGRSRGGLSTKIHLACEQRQKPMSVVVTAGQHADAPQLEPVMERIRVAGHGQSGPARTRPVQVRADKAYSSKRIRAYLSRRKVKATIPEPADRVRHRKRKGRSGGRPSAFVTCRPGRSSGLSERGRDRDLWGSAEKHQGIREQPQQGHPRRAARGAHS